jgi:hypothetical protein
MISLIINYIIAKLILSKDLIIKLYINQINSSDSREQKKLNHH